MKHPLLAFRDANGLNQTEAAKLCGITQAQWSRMEAGLAYASPRAAKRISDVTSISLDVLMDFGGSENESEPDANKEHEASPVSGSIKDMP